VHREELGGDKAGGTKHIITYCTGGIRCEKGARFMADQMEKMEGDKISTLRGGIVAYLLWMDEEVRQGRREPEESLFRGKNYVFDARGSTGLANYSTDPVASCDMCGIASDRLSKCRSKGCHLIMVVCVECEASKDARCCQNCLEMNMASEVDQVDIQDRSRPMCVCERERETELWGDMIINKPKRQGWRKKRRAQEGTGINIRIGTID
jgi:predicted sulfurtransferase